MPSPARALTAQSQLRLLGWWELRVDDETVSLGRREQRLLALLALFGRAPRPQIAGTLWPESTDEHAMTNLRAAVWRTRRVAESTLLVDAATLVLGDGVQVDVDQLTGFATLVLDEPGARHPDEVVTALDRGELLPGWYDDWVLFARERLQHLRFRAYEAVATSLLRSGRPEQAVQAARAGLRIEPLHDGMNLTLVRACLDAGAMVEAVRHFHEYRRLLMRELGVRPHGPIVDLVAPLMEIRRPQGAPWPQRDQR